jgi:hypothetical protein
MKNRLTIFLVFLLCFVLIVAPGTEPQGYDTAGLELTNYFTQPQTFNQGIAIGSSDVVLGVPPVISNYNLVLPGSAGEAGFNICIGSIPGTWTYCASPGIPAVTLTTNIQNFGSVQQNTTVSAAIVIANSGSAQLVFANNPPLMITGSGFTETDTCGLGLDAGATCVVTITFAPVALTSYSGTLMIFDNAPTSSPQQVALSGTGVATAPHSVVLTWTASSSPGVQGYNVYRSTTSGGPYTLLTTPFINATSYTDFSVLAGQQYCYVVTAYSTNYTPSESMYSTETCVIVP